MTAESPVGDAAGREDVTPLELFFDLVFVFAVAQLSRYLALHLTWRGCAETLVLTIPVFAVWLYTSWAATLSGADSRGAQRMVLAVMVPGLFMNASITDAFGGSGVPFVVLFLLIQVSRTWWSYRNAPDSLYRDQFLRVLVWIGATLPLWIAGATVEPSRRLGWWAVAATVDCAGTWLAQPLPGRRLQSQGMSFAAHHMLERCRLFLLVALGETILSTGRAVSEAALAPLAILTGTASLIGVVALWILGFGSAVRVTEPHVDVTSDPVRASRHAANALTLMVLGLIAVAVANEEVIGHPHGPGSLLVRGFVFGGPMCLLLAQAWYVATVPRVSARPRLIGVAGFGLVAIAAVFVSQIVAHILMAVGLTVLAARDARQ